MSRIGPDRSHMPPLLEKLRTLRRRRSRAQKAKSSHATQRHHTWFYWSCVVFAVAAGFGAFFWETSARILKDPITLDYGPRDAAFASAFGPTVGAEFTDGNSIRILINGDQFFPAMLKAIHEAQKTVSLETYIWSSGKISDEFIDAMTERAAHGVKISVMVDGMGTLKFKHADIERLRKGGVNIVKYGREHWWEVKPNINHRTHRKLLIVDGKIGFTGGMCIDDHWLGNADNPKVWRETGVEVEGPVVRQMQAVFATNWLRTTSGLLLGEEYYPKISTEGHTFAQCFHSGPDDNPQNARLGYLFAIASARESIDIAQAYFVPDDLAVETLVAARKRGVHVRVIVPAINDSRFGRAASRSRWGPLLAAGVEFYEYEPAMYHCKTMTVDGTLVTVGSSNFDNRSFAINDEVTLNVLDPGIAAAHRKMFENDIKRSRPLTRDEYESRPWYVKAADNFCGLFRSQL
jgi:cardiolipin synthase